MSILYPTFENNNASRDYQETFAGYNHNIRVSDGEFYDMKNMTGDYYPVLSPRKKRALIKQFDDFEGIICKDSLCYIDKGHLYINGSEIEGFDELSISDTRYKKTMVAMGAYLIIFNNTSKGLINGWYINTENTTDKGFIDNTFEVNLTSANPHEMTLTPCMQDGTEYLFDDVCKGDPNYVYVSSDAPNTSKIRNGYKWLDTSGDIHYIKVWNKSTSMWVSLSTTYVKIAYPQIATGFKEGDAVSISGLQKAKRKTDITSTKINEQLKAMDNTMIIQSLDTEDYGWIVISGILDRVTVLNGGKIALNRQAPYMDYICESNNRLWGCRYGINRNGDTVNEIYACKQGDFKNWFCYAGISTDSYAASVGSDGVFTGVIHFGSYVMFFKENCIHKLYGNMPSDYQLIEQKVRGLQRGSEESLCIVNETLFYKSATDVCYYDGSLPVAISNALGEDNFDNAVAGSIGNKLYISMRNNKGEYSLFVYDIAKQMWHKEDNLQVQAFCRCDKDLYCVDINNNLINLCGGINQEDDFEWYAETGNIGYSYSDNKYVGRMLIRLTKPLTSEARILIQYDDAVDWQHIATLTGCGTRSFSIPVLPRRCDHFRVRIEGRGDVKIYSISKVLEIGSDL